MCSESSRWHFRDFDSRFRFRVQHVPFASLFIFPAAALTSLTFFSNYYGIQMHIEKVIQASSAALTARVIHININIIRKNVSRIAKFQHSRFTRVSLFLRNKIAGSLIEYTYVYRTNRTL